MRRAVLRLPIEQPSPCLLRTGDQWTARALATASTGIQVHLMLFRLRFRSVPPTHYETHPARIRESARRIGRRPEENVPPQTWALSEPRTVTVRLSLALPPGST